MATCRERFAIVPHRIDQRDELALNAPFAQGKIDRPQHLRRPGFDGSVGPQNAADQSRINRSRRAFAADVPDHHSQARLRVIDEVVQVAADGARGHELGRNFQVRELGQRVRQQTKLQFARQRQVAFQTLFLTGDLFIEPGIFDGDRHLRGQRRDRAFVVVGKKSAPGMFQIQHSNDFVFVNQGHGQFRAGFRIQQDISRIFVDVRHQHRLPVLHGIAHQRLCPGERRA